MTENNTAFLDEYLIFQGQKKTSGEVKVDKRNYILTINPSGEIDFQLLLNDLTETLHLPKLTTALLEDDSALEKYLKSFPPRGLILEQLPTNPRSLDLLKYWSLNQNYLIHGITSQNGIDSEFEKKLNRIEGVVHKLNSTKQFTRETFKEISKFSFEDPNLAQDFYNFYDLTNKLDIPYVLVSGACSYLYWGRRPLKDLDILVPSLKDLKKIAKEIDQPVDHLVSSFADTHYLNFAPAVEPVAELSVLYNEKDETIRIPFTFENVISDAKKVRLLGEEVQIMSPEMVVLFKFALGRFGIDQWGKHKDDYEDARGVFVSQSLNSKNLLQRAKEIGAEKRAKLGLSILEINDDN